MPVSEETTSPAAGDSVALELDLPAEADAGAIVPIVLRARNATARTIELHLLGRDIAFDIVVTRADGSIVWRRLHGKTVAAILRLETLSPGEALELEERWDQRTNEGAAVTPGTYAVQGILPTERPEPFQTDWIPLRIH